MIMTDEAHALYCVIWERVQDLVDSMLSDVPEVDAEDIREKLNDEFRFWDRTKRYF